MTNKRERAVRILRVVLAVLLCLYYFTASVFIIQIEGRFPYQYIAVAAGILVAVFFIVNRKFERTDWLLMLVFLSFILSAVSAEINGMPEAYRKLSRSSAFMAVPLYFVSAYLGAESRRSLTLSELIRIILKTMSLVQLVWIFVQYFFYHALSININEIIFRDLLHQEGLVSFYREQFYPAGFTWHGGSIAPLLVIAFVLFRNPVIRLAVVAASFLVGSSTAIIGILAAVFLTFLLALIRKEIDFRKIAAFFCKKNLWKIILGIVILAGLVFLFIRMNLGQIIVDRMTYLLGRLQNPEVDESTLIHTRYFTAYPRIFGESSWTERLFGYGNYSSGYPFQIWYDQYSWMETFVVECDFINILLSRGIIGFVLYYTLLGVIAVKGLKKDSRYFVLIASLVVQGAGYNVQWQYVMMTEVLLFVSLKSGRNFFEKREAGTASVFLSKRPALLKFMNL